MVYPLKISMFALFVRFYSILLVHNEFQIIGIVEQEPCLFTGTVMENITLSRPGITEKDAKRAAHIARADEFINQLQHVGFSATSTSCEKL